MAKKLIFILFINLLLCHYGIAQEEGKILMVSNFRLDKQRCSYVVKDFYSSPDGKKIDLPFYDWKENIIKQQNFPEMYFERFSKEQNKAFFINIHRYFKQRASAIGPRCVRMIENKEAFWRIPFNPRLDNSCPNIFPSKQELSQIHAENPKLYNDLMKWYSEGFGIPYPVFEIIIYNNTDEVVLLTDIIYNVELINEWLPGILENPPISPFVHKLNPESKLDQRIKIGESIAALALKAKNYTSFGILLKSQYGIGYVCKIKMRLVAQYKGREFIISDEKLNFVTILNSKPKRP